MSANNIISLTIKSSSTAIKLNEGDIISLVGTNSNADSKIKYTSNDKTSNIIEVDETPTAIKALAPSLMDVTDSNTGTTLTINAGRVHFAVADGSGCKITLNEEGSAWNQFTVTESVSAIQTAVNAASAGEFVETTGAQTIAGTKTFTSPILQTPAVGITAFAGGGQASATAITASYNEVSTCATAGDSVKLPTAVAGYAITVKNNGAAALDIFPNTSDSIDGLAVNLAVRIQPNSTATFRSNNATVWESTVDTSITLNAPTTVKGQLEIKAADSAGNTVTTITNASQAAARTYTVPDAGASANFVMSEGTATINGAKTFGTAVTVPNGTVGTPGIKTTTTGHGLYEISATQLGASVAGALATVFDTSGIATDSVRNRVNLGTAGAGTVSVVEYGNSKDITTVLTLTNFVVGALAGAGANLAVGNIVYAFPAGQHFELVYSLSSISLTAAGTAVNTDTGLGSVIASGAVNVLSGTGTFEDRLTGQTIATAPTGGAAASALTAATAGIGTGISLNVAGSVKNVFLNSAGTWNANNTGNLTASGTIVLKWTRM